MTGSMLGDGVIFGLLVALGIAMLLLIAKKGEL